MRLAFICSEQSLVPAFASLAKFEIQTILSSIRQAFTISFSFLLHEQLFGRVIWPEDHQLSVSAHARLPVIA